MKRTFLTITAILVAAAYAMTGCRSEYTTYSDREYVMFADTLTSNVVLQDKPSFNVEVASTTVCPYDRTFGVEVVDKGSNAIEGVHYRLPSNTVTIPAGKRSANVVVAGIYDNIKHTDSLGFVLRLVMPEQLHWEMYGDRTKVTFYKSCPFSIDDFTGWCVVTSTFLNDYPGNENSSLQRLVRSELHPTEPNTIILRNFLFTGYHVSITLDTEDPAEPKVTMAEGQVIGDEMSVFGIAYGDNKILADHSPYTLSHFNTCQRFVSLWTWVYVEDLGDAVGSLGQFYNILEWVSDEEADRLHREEGLFKRE